MRGVRAAGPAAEPPKRAEPVCPPPGGGRPAAGMRGFCRAYKEGRERSPEGRERAGGGHGWWGVRAAGPAAEPPKRAEPVCPPPGGGGAESPPLGEDWVKSAGDKLTNTHSVYYNPLQCRGGGCAAPGHETDFFRKGVRAVTTAGQTMDKRMLRTREAIRCALLLLLNQKDASQIKVSELTEKAEISRKTFYLHYASVDEALQELENEIEGWVMTQLAQSDIWGNRHDLYSILSRVDLALREHETYSCYMESRRSRYFMMFRLKNAIAKMVKEQIRENAGTGAEEDDVEAAAEFAVSGILSMYYDWLKAQRITLRQMADKAQRLLNGGMLGLLGKKTEEKE